MYQKLKKILFKFDPETAHKIAENTLKISKINFQY